MHTQAAPATHRNADRLHLSPVLRASLGLPKHAPLSPDDERATASAIWLAREEAWSLVLADPTARSRAVAVIEAASRADVSDVRKDRAEKRALLDALSTEDTTRIALADKDDTILRLAVAVIAPHLGRAAKSCLVRVDAAVARLERHNVRLCLHIIKRRFADVVAVAGTAGPARGCVGKFEAEDLLAWGMAGIRTAALRFDPRRGYKFSTYAVNWIRHAIGRALADHRHTIRLPVHIAEQVKAIVKARSALRSEGLLVTDEAIASRAKLAVKKVRAVYEALSANSGPSLDQVVGADPDDGATVADVVADVDAMDESAWAEADQYRHDAQEVDDAMQAALTEDERFILDCRFGLSRDSDEVDTLEEIGEVLGVSRERVRQKQNEALGKVRRRVAARANG